MNAKRCVNSRGRDLALLMAWVVCGAFPTFAQWVPYGPGPRAQHTAIFDAATDQMIVFGGTDFGTTNYGDVWVALNVVGNCTPTCPLHWGFETPSGTAPA